MNATKKLVIAAFNLAHSCHSCYPWRLNGNHRVSDFLPSMKIGTTRGLEVTRMSHGWAHQAGKNNMTVGPCKGGAEPCKYRICHKNSQDPKSGPGPTPLALCLPTKPPNQSTPQPPVMLTSTRTKSMSEQTHTLIEAESGAQVFPYAGRAVTRRRRPMLPRRGEWGVHAYLTWAHAGATMATI